MDDMKFMFVQVLGIAGLILFCLIVVILVRKVCRFLDEPDKANGVNSSPTIY